MFFHHIILQVVITPMHYSYSGALHKLHLNL